MIDSLYLVMEESQDWNFTVWPIMGQYVWPNYYIGQNYREEVDTLKWWLGKRLTWLDQNFPNESYDCSFIYAGLNDQQGGLSISMNTLFDDEIRIQTRAYAGAIEYRLFDVSGRELRRARTEIAQGGTIVIHDTGLLSSGSYVLQVISSKGMESRRLLRR
jgi:hypothetical protein